MMTELRDVRQIAGEGHRRWFADDYFDLIVWYQEGEIFGFQLCYDRSRKPRAFTWTRDDGARHDRIDDGDDPVLAHKAVPILVPAGAFAATEVITRFQQADANLPREIRDLVISHISLPHRAPPRGVP